MTTPNGVAVVFGAGDGLGPAVARRFARGGGREAARRMVPRGRGTILFTGTTASLRGTARHPRGAYRRGRPDRWIRENFPEMVAPRPPDGLLAPDDIAENYWTLHAQPRRAWTHELDLRPWAEKF